MTRAITIGLLAIAFVAGTIMTNPNTVDALSPWANDMLMRIGVLETQTADLQSQIDALDTTQLKTYRNAEIFNIPDTEIHTFSVFCDPGDVATGGGFGQEPLNPPVVEIINSFPTSLDFGTFPTGWGMTVVSNSPTSSDISVQVVCLDTQ